VLPGRRGGCSISSSESSRCRQELAGRRAQGRELAPHGRERGSIQSRLAPRSRSNAASKQGAIGPRSGARSRARRGRSDRRARSAAPGLGGGRALVISCQTPRPGHAAARSLSRAVTRPVPGQTADVLGVASDLRSTGDRLLARRVSIFPSRTEPPRASRGATSLSPGWRLPWRVRAPEIS
jgi:hypothetical protein